MTKLVKKINLKIIQTIKPKIKSNILSINNNLIKKIIKKSFIINYCVIVQNKILKICINGDIH